MRWLALSVAIAVICSGPSFGQASPNLHALRDRKQADLQASTIVGNENVAITNSSISINDPKVLSQAIGGVLTDGLRSLSAVLRPPVPSGDEEIERIRQMEGTGSERKGAQKAFRLYQLAAQRGNHQARVHSARLLFDLLDPVADRMAIRELEISSKRGNAEAFAWLGWTHDVKRRSDATEADALRLYKEAARRGDAWASFKLGIAYQQGRLGVARNEEFALKYYEESSRSYYAPAILEVAWIAAYGEKQHRSDERARRLFELAAQMGESSAYYHLGDRYLAGRGMPRDAIRAAESFEKAANLGHVSAQNSLGILLLGGTGVPRNVQKAVELFRQAHVAGSIQATVNLGNRYLAGDGVSKNTEEAFALYMKAAQAGNDFAKLFVAELYFFGEGVQKDRGKAQDWFVRALDAGMSNACVPLGEIYSDGKAMKQDYAEAAKWLRRGVKLGNEICRNNLASLIALGRVNAESGEVVSEMFSKAAEASVPAALNNYGLRLINGDGLLQDVERGTDMLLKSADLGFDSARISVADMILKRRGRFAKPQPSLALKFLLEVNTIEVSVTSLLRDLSIAWGQTLSVTDRTKLTQQLQKSLQSPDSEVSRIASVPLVWMHIFVDKNRPSDVMLALQRLYEANEAGDGDAGFIALLLILSEFKPPDSEIPAFLDLAAGVEARPGFMQPFVRALINGLRAGKFSNDDLLRSVVGSQSGEEVVKDLARIELLTSSGQSAVAYLRAQAGAGVEHANFLLCKTFADRKGLPLTAAEIEKCRQLLP